MKYYRGSQPIPGKGDALMFSEVDEQGVVLRTLTYIPATGEVERIPDPVVKFLFRPERLQEVGGIEFDKLWNA
jgi:hypothetical protein